MKTIVHMPLVEMVPQKLSTRFEGSKSAHENYHGLSKRQSKRHLLLNKWTMNFRAMSAPWRAQKSPWRTVFEGQNAAAAACINYVCAMRRGRPSRSSFGKALLPFPPTLPDRELLLLCWQGKVKKTFFLKVFFSKKTHYTYLCHFFRTGRRGYLIP